MEKEVKFTAKSILDIKFEKDVKGYNPLQVDETLDKIIEDYQIYEKEISVNNETVKKLLQEIESLKEKLRLQEIELAKSKTALKAMPKISEGASNNIALLKRIDALERALYQKGVDPKKI